MLWGTIAERGQRYHAEPALLFREEAQKAILSALSLAEFFNHAVFQGGTALRLFYGSPRFSEDLDFVLRGEAEGLTGVAAGAAAVPAGAAKLSTLAAGIASFCRGVFPFLSDVTVEARGRGGEAGVTVERLAVRTYSDTEAQRLRVNLELASVPSRSNQVRVLDYPPLNPAVRVEDAEEILADKVAAIVLRPYLKGRDIWDINFLLRERGLAPDPEASSRKAADYGTPPPAFERALETAADRVAADGAKTLDQDMARFLPAPLFGQYREAFPAIARAVAQTLRGLAPRLP